jgi:hypothetical protein
VKPTFRGLFQEAQGIVSLFCGKGTTHEASIVCGSISRNHKRRKKSPQDGHARVELDSHADTAVFGMACWVTNDTGTLVSVDGFESATMNLSNVSIVTVAVAYDCSVTMQTFILFIHQVIHAPTFDKSLD